MKFNERKFSKADGNQVDRLKQDLDSSISSRNKIQEQTSRELLDTFLDTNNSIHIDNKAQDVKIQRENQKKSDSKVNVISGIDSTITFKGKTIQKQDHPEIYAKYNEIVKNKELNEKEKVNQLEALDRLITSRSALMTANNSIMYKFKRRIYFSTFEHRDEVFSELNKIEPFQGKIEKYQGEFSGEMHYIIKRKEEVEKREYEPIKPVSPKPKPEPKPDTNKQVTSGVSNATIGDIDNSSKVENSGNSTNNINIDMKPMADVISESNKNLIDILIKNINTNTVTSKDEEIRRINDRIDQLMQMIVNNGPIINNNNNNNVNGGGNSPEDYTKLIDELEKRFREMIEKLEEKFGIKFEEFEKRMFEKLEEMKKELNKKLEEMETRLSGKLDKIREEFKEEFEKVHKEIDELSKQIDDIKKEIAEIKLNQEEMKDKLDELLKKQQDLEKKLDEIIKKLDDIKKKLDECCDEKKPDGPDPVPNPEDIHSYEDTAVISNVTEVSREEAEKIAEEELRQEYGKMKRLNPRRRWYFYAREHKIKNRAQKLMNADGRKGLNRDEKFTSGAERHGIELENDLTQIDELVEITEENYPHTYHRIQELLNNYIGISPYTATPISQANFQQEFQNIIEHDPAYDNTNPSIQDVMRRNNMDKVSSDIFSKVDAFKANRALVYDMVSYIHKSHARADEGVDFNKEFADRYRPKIAEYIQNYASMPAFMKRFKDVTGEELLLDNPDMYNKIVAHKFSLSAIQAETLKLNVKLINRGKAAYKVDQKHGAITGIGKFLDRPFAKWIDRSNTGTGRGIKNTLSILMKTASQAGPVAGLGILGGTLIGGPLGTAIGVGIAVGLKTLFGKFSHYSKEHEGHLREQARDMERSSEYRRRMYEAVRNGEYKWYHRVTPNKKGIEYRNFIRYLKTSHDELIRSDQQVNSILALSKKIETLNPGERNALETQISENLVRLDLYRQTGQNFLGSNSEEISEMDFRDIEKALILGSARLGMNLDEIRNLDSYASRQDELRNQYDIHWNRFKKRRRHLGWSKGLMTGAIAGGMSYGISSLGWFDKTNTSTDVVEGKGNFSSIGKRNPAEHFENQFVSGDVDVPLSTTMQNPDIAGMQFNINAGVDELVYNNFTTAQTDLTSKLSSVKSLIKSNFSGANENMLLDALDTKIISKIQSDALGASVDKGNSILLSTRYVEGVEEIANSCINTGKINIPITKIDSSIIHQPSIARAAGNIDFRTMGVDMEYVTKKVVTDIARESRNIPFGEWIDNTFKISAEEQENYLANDDGGTNNPNNNNSDRTRRGDQIRMDEELRRYRRNG